MMVETMVYVREPMPGSVIPTMAGRRATPHASPDPNRLSKAGARW